MEKYEKPCMEVVKIEEELITVDESWLDPPSLSYPS